jgi:hypothetical protein
MADNGEAAGDMTAHVATYNSIIGLLFWGAIGCLLIAGLVIWLIA